MLRIDAHIHYYGDHADNVALLERLNLKLLNICVVHDYEEDWRAREAIPYQTLNNRHPDRYAWCTSFDLPDFDDANYADRVIERLAQDFKAGAIACKAWKNIGMDIRKPSGDFLMIDDPIFDPIFEYLAREEMPLLTHIGEPLACWRPLVKGDPHYGYYSRKPQWHMYNKPEYPSHETIIAARDRMIAKNPKLKIVGAHLGSLEYDVAEVAKRLDEFPNFAVDTSARIADLAYQDSKTVREFFISYPDRLLFGTDMVRRDQASAMTEDERGGQVSDAEARYVMEFAYYETEDVVDVRGIESRGLGLPPEVLAQFYTENAKRWYPGL